MVVRKADISDLKEVFNLYLELDRHYGSKASEDYKKNWIDLSSKFINNNQGDIFVVVDSGKIVSYLLFYFVKGKNRELDNCVFLSELYTSPSSREKGFAGKLIEKFLETDFPSFVTKAIVTADPNAIDVIEFYKKRKFDLIGKTKAGNAKLLLKL